MNSEKQAYLDNIRSNTAYPTYRGIIGIITILMYALAVLTGLAAIGGGLYAMGNSFLGGLFQIILGLISAGIVFLGAKFWKEAALILADIGDSVTDSNSRKAA